MMEEGDAKLNAINTGPATTDCMADQYKYDTIRCRDPKEVGWGADYVCESTGIFLTKETAQAIIHGSAKKVVSSAPAKDDSQVVAMCVNANEYNGSENFISCASYTINGLGLSIIFLTKETAQAIIDGGAKKVVSSAPAKDNSQVVDHGRQRRRVRRQPFRDQFKCKIEILS